MYRNIKAEIEDKLVNEIREALNNLIEKDIIDIENIPEIKVEVPREEAHGDYATNIAMILSGQLGENPRKIAHKLTNYFQSELVKDISVDGPGFINFTLKDKWLYEALKEIIKAGEKYGNLDYGQDKKVQIEFVSANPTGPLHVGHSRGAVVGDVLASILDKAGYNVDKEYYINDAGNQMEILGRSLLIRYKQLLGYEVELPEDCYAGNYLLDIARNLKNKYEDRVLEKSEEEQIELCKNFAYQKLIKRIKKDLKKYDIQFDNWFREKTLHRGRIEEAVNILDKKGYIYKKEGALWFEATAFGDDKDRVVVKSDGSRTYLAADIAYHYNKLKRGYDELINVWGADHHGYIPRIKAVIEAFGYNKVLDVIIVQLVSLLKDGEKVSMSKRSGDFVTMQDVVKEVGKDAARYFYIMRKADSHLDFDLDLAKEESKNNPVYYIQYAHARIFSILQNINDFEVENEVNLSLLDAEAEIDLMKLLAAYPEAIKKSAINKQPHHIANYAYDLANSFHVFYNKCQVITDENELKRARLYLVKATQVVIKNVLSLMGINAPDQM